MTNRTTPPKPADEAAAAEKAAADKAAADAAAAEKAAADKAAADAAAAEKAAADEDQTKEQPTMPDGERQRYVEALRNERAALDNRVDSPEKARRIAGVDAEIDRFADAPSKPSQETA